MIKIVLTAVGVLLLMFVSILAYHFWYSPETVYVDTIRLYESFEMKKELEENLNKTGGARKKILDSLMLDLKILKTEIEKGNYKNQNTLEKYSILNEQYRIRQEQFEKENNLLAQKYNDQIWAQINQYVQDYGKMNNYQYIYGANGQGNIMYAMEQNNITEELTAYINNRYNGNKK